jgi:hypothetical protein
MGLLFPPKFTGKNAPTAEEYESGKVSGLVFEGAGREGRREGGREG